MGMAGRFAAGAAAALGAAGAAGAPKLGMACAVAAGFLTSLCTGVTGATGAAGAAVAVVAEGHRAGASPVLVPGVLAVPGQRFCDKYRPAGECSGYTFSFTSRQWSAVHRFPEKRMLPWPDGQPA